MTRTLSIVNNKKFSTVTKPYYTSFQEVPNNISGVIKFKINNNIFDAYVNPEEGGAWVLILQYNHLGGTNPALRTIPLGTNFPIETTNPLGTNEGASLVTWGHVDFNALSAFPDNVANLEIRLKGRIGSHPRVIHFKTAKIIDRYITNVGNSIDVRGNYTLLSGHTANIPRLVNSSFALQTLTNFPFYTGAAYHWGIQGSVNRWEVDDFNNGFGQSTLHQIWIRYKPATQPNPLITNQALWTGYGGWTFTPNASTVLYGTNIIIFGQASNAAGGVAEQTINLSPGSQRTFTFTTARIGAGGPVMKVQCDIIDVLSNTIIATGVSVANSTTNVSFTANGQTKIRLTDISTGNVASTDVSVSNVLLT